MQEAIDFAMATNPIWPFAALLVDAQGHVICKAVDCAHISPLFHAESLAIHALIQSKKTSNLGKLKLLTTAEPDTLSQSAIYWAKVTHDICIEHIFYGSSLATINSLWSFGIGISAQEMINRSHRTSIHLTGPVFKKECDALFISAKDKQRIINQDHPTRGHLSHDVQDFYELTLLH